ncbi:MAG TPA: hypothetical protein VFP37_16275, partial [Steroidobacteraceae bacterium]|nr:hypothetical protein [Steroidobacteraceae bacterium]
MKSKLIKLGLVALALAPLAALSEDNVSTAMPATDAAGGGTGTVVFFRESKFVGGGMRYKVRENGV